SKADISACPRHVRFTPKSGHRNRHVYHLRRDNSGSLAIFAAIRRLGVRTFLSTLMTARARTDRLAAGYKPYPWPDCRFGESSTRPGMFRMQSLVDTSERLTWIYPHPEARSRFGNAADSSENEMPCGVTQSCYTTRNHSPARSLNLLW